MAKGMKILQSIFGAFLLTWETCQAATGFNFDLKVPTPQQKQQQPVYYVPYPMMAPYGYQQPQYLPQYQMAQPMYDPQSYYARSQADDSQMMRAKDQGMPVHMAQPQAYSYGPMPQYGPVYAQPQQAKDESTKLGFGLNFDDPNKFDIAGLMKNIMGGATGVMNAAGMAKKMEIFQKLLTMNALPNIR